MKKIWKTLILCLAVLPCMLIFTACSKSYTVTFNSNGGSEINSVLVEENNLVSKPDDPIKDGYSFDGWFLGETEWNFEENHVNKDITLTANWTAVEYSITYHLGEATNNIGNPNTYTIESETIELLSPTLANHQFLGWYDNDSFNGMLSRILRVVHLAILTYTQDLCLIKLIPMDLDKSKQQKIFAIT